MSGDWKHECGCDSSEAQAGSTHRFSVRCAAPSAACAAILGSRAVGRQARTRTSSGSGPRRCVAGCPPRPG